MRLATLLTLFALAAATLAGCGGSSSPGGQTRQRSGTGTAKTEAGKVPAGASAASCQPGAASLRAVGVSCASARRVLSAWRAAPPCAAQTAASRTSCGVRFYRCLGTRTDRGIAVSCARPGRSVSFIAKLP